MQLTSGQGVPASRVRRDEIVYPFQPICVCHPQLQCNMHILLCGLGGGIRPPGVHPLVSGDV